MFTTHILKLLSAFINFIHSIPYSVLKSVAAVFTVALYARCHVCVTFLILFFMDF